MVRELKKVWWYDVTPLTWQIPTKPFKNYLVKCWTIGYVQKDKDCVIVSYSNDGENRLCFDVIPKALVIKIENIWKKKY